MKIGPVPPLKEQKPVYFDSNVYIDAFDNQELATKAQLVGVKYNVFYTHENILELLAPRYKNRLTHLLALINCVTYGNLFRADLNGCRFEKMNPIDVYREIADDPTRNVATEAQKKIADMQSDAVLSWRDEIRSKLGLDQKVLNNMLPENAIAHINESLNRIADMSALEGKNAPRNLEEMIIPLLGIHYDAHFRKGESGPPDPLFKDSMIRAAIGIAFSLFDQFGYWSDNPKTNNQFRNTNTDMLHAIAGIEGVAVISGDRRFRNKTQAVYHYYKLPCKVMPTIEGLDYLIEN